MHGRRCLFLLILAICLVLVGCSDSSANTNATDVVFRTSSVTLTAENPSMSVGYSTVPNAARSDNISFVSSNPSAVSVVNDIEARTILITRLSQEAAEAEIYARLADGTISSTAIKVVCEAGAAAPGGGGGGGGSPSGGGGDVPITKTFYFSEDHIVLTQSEPSKTLSFEYTGGELPEGFKFLSTSIYLDITWDLSARTVTITRNKNIGSKGHYVFPVFDDAHYIDEGRTYLIVDTEPDIPTPEPGTSIITFMEDTVVLTDKVLEYQVEFFITPESTSMDGLEFYCSDPDSIDVEWDGSSNFITVRRSPLVKNPSCTVSARNNKELLLCPKPLNVVVVPVGSETELYSVVFECSSLDWDENDMEETVSFITYPENCSLDGLSFISTDPEIATVEWDGVSRSITVRRERDGHLGDARIKAMIRDGAFGGDIAVRVRASESMPDVYLSFDYVGNDGVSLSDVDPVAEIRFYLSVPLGQEYDLEFHSSDESLVSVDWDGRSDYITLKKVGDSERGNVEITAIVSCNGYTRKTVLPVAVLNDNVYSIESEEDLLKWRSALISDDSIDAVLLNDIVLTKPWEPIPSFSGSFDGGNHTISGFVLESVNQSSYILTAGLFGELLSTGSVSNLNLKGEIALLSISEHTYVGAVAGDSSGRIENCSFDGSIKVEKSVLDPMNIWVGGIVGNTDDGFVEKCTTSGSIVSKGDVAVGGLVGEGYNSVISDCSSSMSMDLSDGSDGGGIAGGFIGEVYDSHYSGYINVVNGSAGGLFSGNSGCYVKGCIFDGHIEVEYSGEKNGGSIGGLSSGASSSDFIDCVATGSIDVELMQRNDFHNLHVGGLFGKLSNASHVYNCVSDMNIEINASEVYFNLYVGGIAGWVQHDTEFDATLLEHSSSSGTIDIVINGVSDGGVHTVGGIAGLYGGFPGYILACDSSTEITVDDSTDHSLLVGGVIGQNLSCDVVACIFAGNISVDGYEEQYHQLGGVCGNINNTYAENPSAIISSAFVGGMTGSWGQGNVGAAVGIAYQNSCIKQCYWSPDSDGNPDVGIGYADNEAQKEEAIKVDGESVRWSSAIQDMNQAIDEWNRENPDFSCDYHYVMGNDGLPEIVVR